MALREWLENLPPDIRATKADKETVKLKDTSWGPEVHEEEPNDNTRAIT